MAGNRKQYLKYLNPMQILQTKKVLKNNPTLPTRDDNATPSIISHYQFCSEEYMLTREIAVAKVKPFLFKDGFRHWLNLDIIHKETVEVLGKNLGLHYLIIEDILAENERPKLDEIEHYMVCVMHMLYFNHQTESIENEQVSFVLGHNYLISFQDDSVRDTFDMVREKLSINNSKVRQQQNDYLLYALMDSIVDQYYIVLEKLGDRIELLEEEITNGKADNFTMNRINSLRKELIFFQRNAHPVKDLINTILKSENPLIQEGTKKYFKDVYDHAVQINDLTENYRDVIINIRDLYHSQMNLKMNEVMKFLAIVTALLAPATVIGGIFGMNFDRIPYLHDQNGFWIATFLMLIAPILMLVYFKRKEWF